MPYVFVEELIEGLEEADVVERSELETITSERDEARQQRDDAIERAVKAESDLTAQKEKFANTFFQQRSQMPKPNKNMPKPATMDAFKIGGGF